MEINEQKIRNILIEQREEYQRFLSVVSENFESQVKIIAETLSSTQQQLVSIRDMVAKNTEDIEIIKMESQIIRNDLKEKISRDEFKILETRISKLEKSIHQK
ncbi:MAG: hypothetical protein COU07_02580 [Candidatus Harrisonbacteria bacterium CG10_big_fil_rev_8_21_14_0_10_40_38]|uniref:Uncharacterized protein n=1 Tax=Candidatus Harrisonbacteria bacterium CG10_big_fil_rev_8_21_14_0_10_40_38 TaxID=1974583 RepID=A0A2H0URS1_9BACT|nr:MAG: hypothetical protein COU07_02580 [Candidatus Harrisonbacteria bacterium CG10_big_fil_rev_8_21_14_0_10_40_38]